MKQLQADKLTAKAIRDALKTGEEVVLYGGDEPLAKLVSVAAELQRRADHFMHYPHDAAECLGTCWRHDGSGETDDADTPKTEAELELADA